MPDFDFSLSGIMSSLVFGVVGLWAFRRGKQNGSMIDVSIGLALMIYPYFTSSPWTDWGVGFILCGILYLLG